MKCFKSTCALILAVLSLQATAVQAKTYRIKVFVAGAPAFSDCLILQDDGRLAFGRDPMRLRWTYDSAGNGNAFIATTEGGDRVISYTRLALHGSFDGDRIVDGNAVNGDGLTYSFVGTVDEKCPGDNRALHPGGSEYGALPIVADRLARDSGPVYEWALGTFAVPPGDCFGFDCGLMPQPTAAAATDPAPYPFPDLTGTRPVKPQPPRKGDRVSVAGRSFRVLLKPADRASITVDDCWLFGPDGRIKNSLGLDLVWGPIDAAAPDREPEPGSFQSVGASGTRHGMAFNGRMIRLGEMDLSGIRVWRGETTALGGHAFLVNGC